MPCLLVFVLFSAATGSTGNPKLDTLTQRFSVFKENITYINFKDQTEKNEEKRSRSTIYILVRASPWTFHVSKADILCALHMHTQPDIKRETKIEQSC